MLCCGVLVQLTLFVGGVLEESEEELVRLLSPFGPILRSVVVTNPAVSGRCEYEKYPFGTSQSCML